MRIRQTYLYLLLALITITLVSCSSSSDSPTTPSNSNVDGVWSFTGQLIQDACNLSASPTFIAAITFFQNGSTVTTPRVDITIGDLFMFFTYRGAVTGNNVSMAAVDPYVFQDGGIVINYGSGIDIQNIRLNSTGDGSFNITGDCIQGCNTSCQTIWSGAWTKN